MELEAKAPRLEAYWRRIEDRSVLSMPRAAWDTFAASSGNAVVIDVLESPLGSVAEQSSVVAAVAQRFSPDEGRISIYRSNPEDSEPINVDHYRVHLNLSVNSRLSEMISAASTSYNANMGNYRRQHVHRHCQVDVERRAPPPMRR